MKNSIQELAYKVCKILEEHTSLSIQELKVKCDMSEREVFLTTGWLMHEERVVYDMENDKILIGSRTEDFDSTSYHTYSMT